MFISFHASDTFNFNSFETQLSALVTPEFSLLTPHGTGTYAGLNDAAENLSLTFDSVNVGSHSYNFSDTAGVLPALSIEGDAYTVKTNFAANFFPTVTPPFRLPTQTEIVFTFAPCRSRSTHPLVQ